MSKEANEGREPAEGIKNAYIATEADLETYKVAESRIRAMKPDLPDFKLIGNDNRYIFVAAFDGTGNDATQTLTERTNVHSLYQDFDSFARGGPDSLGFGRMHAQYIEGPATQSNDGWNPTNNDQATGTSVQDRVYEMYKDLGDKALQWKAQNPNAEISVITIGFSRGAVEAAEFASAVGKYGIQANLDYRTLPDDDIRNPTKKQSWSEWWNNQAPKGMDKEFREFSGELVAPGKVPIVAGLYDPVATGVAEKHDRALPPSIRSALQIAAKDEHRVFFPLNTIVNDKLVQSDPTRFASVMVAGAHSDIGGGYAQGKGLAQLSNGLMGDYLNKVVGIQICKSITPDPNSLIVHDSNVGAVKQAGKAPEPLGGKGHEFADRTQTAATVQDGKKVLSGVDPTISGTRHWNDDKSKYTVYQALDPAHMRLDRTADAELRGKAPAVESRLHPRPDDHHTPKGKSAQFSAESPVSGPLRDHQPARNSQAMLLESSTRIATLMDKTANPTSASLISSRMTVAVQQSIQQHGDSAQGRLSAAIASAAAHAGMDRVGEVAFSADNRKLIVTDHRSTHLNDSKHASVDIAAALKIPTAQHIDGLDPLLRQHHSIAPTHSAHLPRVSLYEQAFNQLDRLGVPMKATDQAEAARAIASQANHDGLTGIDRLELAKGENGKQQLIAHQGESRQSAPIDAASVLMAHGPNPNPVRDQPQQEAPAKLAM